MGLRVCQIIGVFIWAVHTLKKKEFQASSLTPYVFKLVTFAQGVAMLGLLNVNYRDWIEDFLQNQIELFFTGKWTTLSSEYVFDEEFDEAVNYYYHGKATDYRLSINMLHSCLYEVVVYSLLWIAVGVLYCVGKMNTNLSSDQNCL